MIAPDGGFGKGYRSGKSASLGQKRHPKRHGATFGTAGITLSLGQS
jgi:hypothetical protein